jgi:TatD DNase family protein
MRPSWVDFHCHVDLYPDHIEVIAECDREQVATLAVTTTPKAWRRNHDLAQNSGHVRIALGLHPQLVAQRAEEITLFESLLAETRYVGEVGLDAGPRFYRSFAEQERVFARILAACAEQGGKILTIHSVRSVGKVLDHLESRLLPDKGSAVLHWFTGTPSEAKRAVELGCYFSINSEMMKSPKHKALIANLPRNRLLTETDGPFVSIEDRAARPHDVVRTVAMLADTIGMSPTDAGLLVIRNLAVLTRPQ